MKVSFLVPDINSSALGAATGLARHLMPEFETEIVGPDLGHGVCPMYRGAFPYTVVPALRIYRFPEYFRESRELARAVTGDVIIAVKAAASTIPVALRLKRERGVKVVAYLDEWDGALYHRLSASEKISRWLHHAHHPLDDVYYPLVEKQIPQCDLVISTTTFLQNKFGGEIVHMGVNTDWFKPQPPEATAALRKQFGLDGKKLIVFGGVVRPHKGIELILDALVQLSRDNIRFVIVGPKNVHVEELFRNPARLPFLVATGPQPKNKMPQFLDLADLCVLPLDQSLLAQSQMPCKIFEAMAMAKPVIATDISDLPLVVKGCGRLVPANHAGALADAIADVLDHPDESAKMGMAAREKCIREYSCATTRAKLQQLIGGL